MISSKINENNEDNSGLFIDNLSIQKEKKIKYGENLNIQNSMLLNKKSQKSVCEIVLKNGYGSGFFCKMLYENKDIYCLFTNNHVINEEMLSKKEDIEIKLNKKNYTISLNLNRRVWTNINLDFTCIEILKKDKVFSKIDVFEIDRYNYNIEYELSNYDKRGIVIASIGNMEEIELPQGVIYYINKNDEKFFHNANTDAGFSGGAIILVNNLKIMGIHCGYEKNNKKNIGIYFKEILEYIEKKTIKLSIEIKSNELNKDILLFNQNVYNKEEIKDNIRVFLNNKNIQLINKENEWKITYNFEKIGVYELKMRFINIMSDLGKLFEKNINILSIDLSNFDLSNVKSMRYMFNKCYKLKKIIGINNVNTNNINDMSGMFQLCENLEYLDLSNFDTSKVTNMRFMFNECNKLKEIKGLNKLNTSNVCDMNLMFQLCISLEYLDLSNFDTSKTKSMSWIFNKCYNLKEIKGINNFNTSKVTEMSEMFNECNYLESLDLSNFDISNTKNIEYIFYGCNKIKEMKGRDKFIQKSIKDITGSLHERKTF